MRDNLTHPIQHCLEQRAQHLGHPDTCDWVVSDPVVSCFAPALHLLAQDGLVTLEEHLQDICVGIYWQVTARWVKQEETLKRMLSQLFTAGIEVIPLKGAALLETIYPQIGLRSMEDIDMLVRKTDFIAAVELLLAQGFQPKWLHDTGLFDFMHLPEAYWPGALSFYHPEGLYIDVHRDLVTYHWYKDAFKVDSTSIWAHSYQPIQSKNSLWKRFLSPYDLLGHLCLHLALHGLQIMKNFFDVDQFVRNLPSDWDWANYLKRAESWGIRSVSYHVFVFCQAIFDTPFPEEVVQSLRPAIFDRWLVKSLITPQILLRNHQSLGMRYPSLVKFALFDGFFIKLISIYQLLFPSKAWLKSNPSYQTYYKHWMHLWNVFIRGN